MKYIAMISMVAVLWAGPTSQYLADMNQSSKENIEIQLEINGMPTQDMRYAEDLWNTGRYDDAVALIEKLEEEHGAVCFAMNYRQPTFASNPRWADDVMVNSNGYYYRELELIYGDTGNYFVIARADSGGTYQWFVMMSTDGGSNWAQTASWYGASSPIPSVDAGEYTGFVYVAYCTESASNNGRIRRVNSSTGAMDTGFAGTGFVDVFTSPDNVVEVNFEPNRETWGEMYFGAIDDGNILHWFYTTDPTTWNGIAVNVTNAERGLDMDYGWLSSGHYLWMSYITTADSVCARARTPGSWGVHDNIDDVNTMSYAPTAIAMHGDTVLIPFLDTDFNVAYRITYDDGGSWLLGTIDSDSSACGDATGRGNEGWQVSWSKYDNNAPEDIYYRTRGYSGSWQTEQLVSEYDAYIQYRTSIDYLGAPGVYGIAYIDDNYDIYFDRLDWQPGVAEYTPVDDFSRFVTLAPNPTRSHVNLTVALNMDGMVKISMYDATGRLVKNIMNENQSAGTYTLTLDNHDLASGLYFVRVETDAGTTTKKMTLIR
jgi:hypothetical protein